MISKIRLKTHLASNPVKKKFLFTSLPFSILRHVFSFSSHSAATTKPLQSKISREQLIHSLLKQSSTEMDLKQIHAHIFKTALYQNLVIIGKIISHCAVSLPQSMDYAMTVFEHIETPDGFIWNSMIRGVGKTSESNRAFGFYKRMLGNGEKADNFTYSFLLKTCVKLGDLSLGKQTHCSSLKDGLDVHVFVRNTLIHMYGMLKDIKAADYLFEEIPKPDVVAWNTIIDCYVSLGKYKEALDMFFRMHQSGIQLDDATAVIVLSACSDLGAMDFGEWVYSLISRNFLDRNVPVLNAVVDMYAKCGELKRAHSVFEKIKMKNIVTWNSMIQGLAIHGHVDKALELYNEMQKSKVEMPNDVTFLGVLCACSHGGLVDEGRRYFASMTNDYGIKPTIMHYGCMVDLFGRAGLVKEAYDLIVSMPMECNAIVWRTLLGACRVHGELELGERVRKHILELEPDHSGDYVLLANIYASEGRWTDMLEVRETMRDRRVQKPMPGNSLIGYPAS